MSDYITIPLSKQGKNKGKYETIVDVADSDLAAYRWAVLFVANQPSLMYVQNSYKRLLLHRVILARKLERDELLPTEQVDHINGNGLDNRRKNLRLATQSQNNANQGKNSSNTSGYKGVTKQGKRWQATISINGKNKNLGRFDTPEQAYKVYCEKAIELHGEFARLE